MQQVAHTCELALGDPRTHVCDFVDDKKCELLIMGSRGMGALKRYACTALWSGSFLSLLGLTHPGLAIRFLADLRISVIVKRESRRMH